MFIKKFLICIMCTFLVASCVLIVKAHWKDDPGPTVIEGNPDHMVSDSDFSYVPPYREKSWTLKKIVLDSQWNITLEAKVYHKKKVKGGFVKKAEGTAFCSVWSATYISGEWTKGEYDVHAQARGRWTYSGKRKKNKYFAGVSSQAEKSAGRYRFSQESATFSGVHLKGKSHIDSQAGSIKLQVNWY